MNPLTLFTWGYWGWGTAAERFVEAADAVEAARGFAPPVFADIRWRRQGRAPNFVGDRFETLVGPARYRWFQGLGNRAVSEGGMEIARPADAETLLDLAVQSAKSRRRVLFFCACEVPGTPDNIQCHRCLVASLVLDAARRRKLTVQIVEWPGGEPRLGGELTLSREDFAKVRRGGRAIPLRPPFDLAEVGSLPWYSVVTVRGASDAEELAVRVGPAQFHASRGGWCVPVFGQAVPVDSRDELFGESLAMFDRDGFTARTTP